MAKINDIIASIENNTKKTMKKEDVIALLREIRPTATLIKNGDSISGSYTNYDLYTCSHCKYDEIIEDDHDFCPKCGAEFTSTQY